MQEPPSVARIELAPEALLATLAAAIGDAVIAIDVDGRILYLNPAAESMYGWSCEEARGRRARELLVAGHDRDEAARAMDVLRREGIWRGELGVVRRDGSTIRARVTNAVVRGPDGRVAGYVGVSRDVSRERAEVLELERMRVLLQEVERIAGLGTFEWDVRAGVSTWNARLFELYGLDPATTVPGWEAFFSLLPEDEANRMRASMATMGNADRYDADYRIVRPDGESRFIHSRGEFLRDADGRPVRLVGTAMDVTENRRMLLRATRGEQLLKEAQELANVGSWERVSDSETLTWSAHTYRVHGVDPATFTPTHTAVMALVHPEDRAYVEKALRDLSQTGSAEGSYRVTRPDGSIRYVEARARFLHGDGGPDRIVGVVQDVTARVESERALQAARDAHLSRERLAALGTLVAGVAHEINNPMAYVRGNAELIDLAAQDLAAAPSTVAEASRQMTDLARLIVKGAEQVEHITRTLKELARPASGAPAPLDMLVLLEEVGALALARAPASCRLQVVCPPGTIASANPHAARQILLNLALNAVEATRDREEPILELSARAEGDMVAIELRDNGSGIPVEHRGKVFVPFFTTRPDGTGLGLSLSHQLATEQGGALTFETGPQGTTFRLALPRHLAGRTPG